MNLTEGSEVSYALNNLGLDYEGLVEVLRYADGERALVTADDPRGFDLIVMNARTARGLRHKYCGDQWQADETDNQAGIVNLQTKIRIIHCNFDKYAGNRLKNPTNLTEKGTASRVKVACNQTAWIPGLPVPGEGQVDGEITTYVLGTYYDKEADVLRAELSRPRKFSSGRYTSFAERIILLDDSEGAPVRGNSEREGPTEVIDIAVTRK